MGDVDGHKVTREANLRANDWKAIARKLYDAAGKTPDWWLAPGLRLEEAIAAYDAARDAELPDGIEGQVYLEERHGKTKQR